MFERAGLVHYHEIGLKGRNRSAFENRLKDNLDFAVRGLTDSRAERISSRLLVPSTDPSNREGLLLACAALPGVAHVSDALTCSRTLDEITTAAAVAMREEIVRRGTDAPLTFAVHARRSDTDFSTSSMEDWMNFVES